MTERLHPKDINPYDLGDVARARQALRALRSGDVHNPEGLREWAEAVLARERVDSEVLQPYLKEYLGEE